MLFPSSRSSYQAHERFPLYPWMEHEYTCLMKETTLCRHPLVFKKKILARSSFPSSFLRRRQWAARRATQRQRPLHQVRVGRSCCVLRQPRNVSLYQPFSIFSDAPSVLKKGVPGDPTSCNRPKKDVKDRPCFNCGATGHLSKDCPQPKLKFAKKGSENCYKCGKPGHLSRDCTTVTEKKGARFFPFWSLPFTELTEPYAPSEGHSEGGDRTAMFQLPQIWTPIKGVRCWAASDK